MPSTTNRERALNGLTAMWSLEALPQLREVLSPEGEYVDNLGQVGQVKMTMLLADLRHTAQVGGLDFASAVENSAEMYVEDMAEEL